MQVEAGTLDQPVVHQPGLVGGGVVEHEVDVEVGRNGGLDLVQERPELERAVPPFAPGSEKVSRSRQRPPGHAIGSAEPSLLVGMVRCVLMGLPTVYEEGFESYADKMPIDVGEAASQS
jgi:hypothetical protein